MYHASGDLGGFVGDHGDMNGHDPGASRRSVSPRRPSVDDEPGAELLVDVRCHPWTHLADGSLTRKHLDERLHESCGPLAQWAGVSPLDRRRQHWPHAGKRQGDLTR